MERIASRLSNREHLLPTYGLLFGMPGVPAVYYGSEWGIKGRKSARDNALRPAIERPEWNGLMTRFSVWRQHAEKAAPYILTPGAEGPLI